MMPKANPELVVDHEGHRIRVIPPDEVTFGRHETVSLRLDRHAVDPALHNVAGRFRFVEGAWCVENRGSRLELRVRSAECEVVLPPHANRRLAAPLCVLTRSGTVQVVANRRFAISFDQVGQLRGPEQQEATGPTTEYRLPQSAPSTTLTPRQVDLLLALAEPRLLDSNRPPWVVPSSQVLQRRLSLAHSSVNNLVQQTWDVIEHHPDLPAGGHYDNEDRRFRMAVWAIEQRVVTRQMLAEKGWPK